VVGRNPGESPEFRAEDAALDTGKYPGTGAVGAQSQAGYLSSRSG